MTGMTFSTDIVPLGERAWQSVLDHVVAVGDAAETTYLEVKSTLDVASKAGRAKVAKFLLGAANRLPTEANRHFNGHAVLVIGAEAGSALGVSKGTEAHDLENSLRPYLGPQFPPFEFGRISVGDEREVLFVIAQPPQDGQPPFPCHKTYQGDDRRDSLEDGAVYVRGASNTRPARAGEMLTLVERAKGGGKTPIELDVQVLGPVNRVARVDEMLGLLYDGEDERFSSPQKAADRTSALLAANVFGRTQPLTPEEREEHLAAWRRARPHHIARGREYLLGVTLPGSGIQVVSHGRFVAKPHLVVTFHDCEAFDFRDEDADLDKVVEPVVRSGDPFMLGSRLDPLRLQPRGYPVAWENKNDDLEVMLTPESLRPDSPWSSEQDDYAVVARDPQASTVSVTWVLTEEGSDAVTRGKLTIPTREIVDAAELLRQVLSPEP